MIRYIIEIGNPITHRFSSAIRNPIDPSNSTYPDSLGDPIRYPVRLAIPKVANKISDSISGSVKIPQYTFSISNEDGRFDDVESLGWFNIPVVVKRSDKENALLSDFSEIVCGIIDYPVVKEKSIELKINNIYRSLTEEVTKTFTVDDYPNLPDTNIDKNIPIAYGPDLMNVPLFNIDGINDYIAIDPDYLTGVTTVYDSDGLSISFTETLGIITAIDAVSADVSGANGNTIGDIITSEIALKSLIPYNSDNWDLSESDDYIIKSALLNFYFKGGTVRQLVDNALKSDNAFLFTKNNGKLTIRQWGKLYNIFVIANGKIMPKFPKKDYQDALRYYNSTATILYDKDILSGIYENRKSSGTVPAFDKERKAEYPTDLYVTGEIIDLGDRLIKRFGTLSEIIKLPLGVSTIDINLLDEIQIDVNINGRQFSNKSKWIVREGDPGQDTVTLEAKSGFIDPETIDGVLSQPGSNITGFVDGVLSQPFWFGLTGQNNSQPMSIIEEEI